MTAFLICRAAIQQHPTRLCDPLFHHAWGNRPRPLLQQPQSGHWGPFAAPLRLHHVHGPPELSHRHHE